MAKTPTMPFSADSCILSPGDTIWVNNSVLGWPPFRAVVHKFEGNNVVFTERCNGYEGCKLSACWVDLKKALAYAIMVGE